MYKFDEQALRKGINMGLGSQGIWTPELEDIMFNEITDEALRIHDVVGRSEQLVCDSCGCHPNVIYTTSKGRFCERCKPAN